MRNGIINTIICIAIVFLLISLFLMLYYKKEIPNHIIEIDYEKYSEVINNDEYNIILLTSPDCSHCKSYKPDVNYVADEYNLTIYDIVINKLTYDQYMEIHDTYQATKDHYINETTPSILTPTTIIIKNGEEIVSISNNLGYTGFINLLESYEIINKK